MALPYSTVQNSYNQFMGIPPTPNRDYSGPIQYNTGLQNLRAVGDTTSINTMGSGTPEDRIQSMADKQYEKWAAGNEFRSRASQEYNAAEADILKGLPRDPRLTGGNYFPSNKGKGQNNDYQRFMSNEGAAGLFGGSTSSPEERMRDWNSVVRTQSQNYGNAMKPLWEKYGKQPMNLGTQTLW